MPTRIQWHSVEAEWNGKRWVTPATPQVGAYITIEGAAYPSAWYVPDEGAAQAAWLSESLGVEILELADPPGADDKPGAIY
tara:strand:+ start:429 stop:671 length:243 start_codon:yes stop_codon:yes gene_type:complete